MLDHRTRKLLGWVCGDRDRATGQRIIEEFQGSLSRICADHYAPYVEIAGAIPLTQGKSHTYQIEQNNGQQRHWLASFHRRSQTVTRSLPMLHARLKLFARYRVNGDIVDLIAPLRLPSSHPNPKSILK